MSDFSTNIKNFKQNGTYTYKFDKVGNLTFNSSSTDFSQVYMAFPLQNVILNNGKVIKFFNSEFEEFIPMTGSIQSVSETEILQEQLDVLQSENISLKEQLDSTISQVSMSGSADVLAVKQVILELRKSLGQGRVESDFSNDFPYTPIRKTTI